MISEFIKNREPLVYTSLLNDLCDKKIAHSYLFCGQKSPIKLETAYLLASSIIDNCNGFIDESAQTYTRVKEHKHLNFLFVDGAEELIKKEDMEEVLNEFSKTALEKGGKKVYVINNINNATPKVLNMILKFMEEPSNDNTFGIFISDNVEGLLNTVVSRCEKIIFKVNDFSYIKEQYLAKAYDLIDAYLLSEIYHEYVNDIDNYLEVKDYVFKTAEIIKEHGDLEYMYISEFYSNKKFKDLSGCYIDVMIKVLDDSVCDKKIGDIEYDQLIDDVKENNVKVLEVFLQAKAKMEACASLDNKLLFDQIAYNI